MVFLIKGGSVVSRRPKNCQYGIPSQTVPIPVITLTIKFIRVCNSLTVRAKVSTDSDVLMPYDISVFTDLPKHIGVDLIRVTSHRRAVLHAIIIFALIY